MVGLSVLKMVTFFATHVTYLKNFRENYTSKERFIQYYNLCVITLSKLLVTYNVTMSTESETEKTRKRDREGYRKRKWARESDRGRKRERESKRVKYGEKDP